MVTLVLFLILTEKLSIFHHSVWYLLWSSHLWSSVMLRCILCIPKLVGFYETLMNEIVLYQILYPQLSKWSYDFVFPSVNVIYHIYCFAHIVPTLHSGSESDVIMVYDSFTVLLDWFADILWEFLCLYLSGILTYGFLFF